MKCDRCQLERTTYKYLEKNYCLPCNYGIYAVNKEELDKLRDHIKTIHTRIEDAAKLMQKELAL